MFRQLCGSARVDYDMLTVRGAFNKHLSERDNVVIWDTVSVPKILGTCLDQYRNRDLLF